MRKLRYEPTNQQTNYYQQQRLYRTWLTPDQKETEMEDGRDGILKLTSVEIIFNIHGWVIFMFFAGI